MILSPLLILIVLLNTVAEAQRSMVMTSWFGTGTRNVKHETVANNVIDRDGNLVPQKSNAKTDASGRTVYSCTDIMGKLREDGEEYERPNGKFKYKCVNGIETITACIGSGRTGHDVIKAGQTLNKDGFWHKCTHNANNETAVYTEETACNVNDKLYHVGDEIRSAFFIMKCSEDGYKIIGKQYEPVCVCLGCYYIGTNKQKVDMKPGSTAELDGQVHHCDDNDGNIQYYTTASGCMKYGNKYKEGEQFAANHLRYECRNGMVDVIGCYMGDMERNIEIGDSIVDKHMIYRCYLENGAVKYEEYPCGLKGTVSCEAPPKQQIPSDLPLMPKINPGFGAFSIAQVDSIAVASVTAYQPVILDKSYRNITGSFKNHCAALSNSYFAMHSDFLDSPKTLEHVNRGSDKVVTGSNTVRMEVARLDGIHSIHRFPSP